MRFFRPRVNFTLFWQSVAVVSMFQRHQLAYQVATDVTFAARMFKAQSATAQLRTVTGILQNVELVITYAAEDA